MSKRVDGGAAADTPVAVPAGQEQLDEYGILGDLEPGTRVLVIGNPAMAAYAVAGTPAALRLFALRVLATALVLPQDGGLLPGRDPGLNINDQPSPLGDLVERIMDEAPVGGWGEIADFGDVAAVEVEDPPAGKFLLACVPVPEPR